MAERRVSSRLMRPKTPRFWPEMKTRRGFGGIVAAVSLVDIGTLDLAAGEPLSGFDDGAQRVAVIRIAGQRPDVQNKLATRCPGIGGDDGSFHTEFVRRAGLALADALHLRSVEGIQLPAALELLLRAGSDRHARVARRIPPRVLPPMARLWKRVHSRGGRERRLSMGGPLSPAAVESTGRDLSLSCEPPLNRSSSRTLSGDARAVVSDSIDRAVEVI